MRPLHIVYRGQQAYQYLMLVMNERLCGCASARASSASSPPPCANFIPVAAGFPYPPGAERDANAPA